MLPSEAANPFHPLEEAHARRLLDLIEKDREGLALWLPPWAEATSESRLRGLIADIRRRNQESQAFLTGVWQDKELAGVAGFETVDWRHRKACLGCWLGRDFRGRGLMTQTARKLVDYAFRSLLLHRVEMRCLAGDTPTEGLARRLGLLPEGIARDALWDGKAFRSESCYALLRPEYEKAQSQTAAS